MMNCRSLVGSLSIVISSSSDRSVEVLGEAQPVAAVFQRADRLLEGLLVGLADAHHLADGAHLRAQLVLGALNFSKAQRENFTTT